MASARTAPGRLGLTSTPVVDSVTVGSSPGVTPSDHQRLVGLMLSTRPAASAVRSVRSSTAPASAGPMDANELGADEDGIDQGRVVDDDQTRRARTPTSVAQPMQRDEEEERQREVPCAMTATPRIHRRSASSRGPAVTPATRSSQATGTALTATARRRTQQHAALGSVRRAVGEEIADVASIETTDTRMATTEHDDGTGLGHRCGHGDDGKGDRHRHDDADDVSGRVRGTAIATRPARTRSRRARWRWSRPLRRRLPRRTRGRRPVAAGPNPPASTRATTRPSPEDLPTDSAEWLFRWGGRVDSSGPDGRGNDGDDQLVGGIRWSGCRP